jgi:uncharacterized surface protein with fasciclin (FAS1) repeats
MTHDVLESIAGESHMKIQSLVVLLLALSGCDKAPASTTSQPSGSATSNAAEAPAEPTPNPALAIPENGPKNVVHVALGSKDHTTLVTALKSADYVDSLLNPGPVTVFAPTNAAFDKLPKGTVEGLLTPEKKADLKGILQYHVAVSTYQAKDLKDGQTLGMANGKRVTFHVKDGKVMVNDATIIASIPASNGIVHVIDGVLLPPQ